MTCILINLGYLLIFLKLTSVVLIYLRYTIVLSAMYRGSILVKNIAVDLFRGLI